MRRRLFLQSGSAAAVVALTGCGGGGGGAAVGETAIDASAAGAPVQAGPLPVADVGKPNVGAKSLPEKILACYYTTWETSRYKVTDVPLEFNVIYLFHAKPDGKARGGSYNNVGDGGFFFEHYDDVTAEQIQTCRDRGQRVILTVGGAHAGYAWDNRTKSQNFIKSVQTMYARLGGFDGIDFNNYEATILNPRNVDAVSAEMVWIASQLKATYGSEFAITSPPQPNSPEQQKLMGALAAAGVLDYAGPQFYDWTGFNAPGYIKTRMDTWMQVLGDPKKAVVGLSGNYSNGPSMADCLREWDAVKAQYPDIRGMFCWSAQTQLAGGNAWGKLMKARLG